MTSPSASSATTQNAKVVAAIFILLFPKRGGTPGPPPGSCPGNARRDPARAYCPFDISPGKGAALDGAGAGATGGADAGAEVAAAGIFNFCPTLIRVVARLLAA